MLHLEFVPAHPPIRGRDYILRLLVRGWDTVPRTSGLGYAVLGLLVRGWDTVLGLLVRGEGTFSRIGSVVGLGSKLLVRGWVGFHGGEAGSRRM